MCVCVCVGTPTCVWEFPLEPLSRFLISLKPVKGRGGVTAEECVWALQCVRVHLCTLRIVSYCTQHMAYTKPRAAGGWRYQRSLRCRAPAAR